MNEFLYREVKRHLSLPLALVPFPGPSTFDLEFPVTIELAVVDGSLGAVAALVPGLEPFTSDAEREAYERVTGAYERLPQKEGWLLDHLPM